MSEENKTGFGMIIGMEFAYMFAVMVLAAVTSFIQLLGKSYSHKSSGIMFSGDVYSYNIFMYLLGTILFVAGVLVLYRYTFSKYVDALAGFNVGYSITVWIISLVLGVVMWYGLVVEFFMFIGFGDMEPDSLIWVTTVGFPVYTAGVIGVMLIRTRR